MQRLISAFRNSARAFDTLARRETAFQQELFGLLAALPVGWFLSYTWAGYALLLGSLLLLLMVEVLNTAIEAACDAISTEFDANIRLAKDCGSLAVLISIILVGAVWLVALVQRLGDWL